MTIEEMETGPPKSRSRRSKCWFALSAVGLALILALVIGIPVAELITRSVVKREYLEKVQVFNAKGNTIPPVYGYRTYIAAPEDNIEYRLRPNHARPAFNVPGMWRRAESTHSYVAEAWNLVDTKTYQAKGYLAWRFVDHPENSRWLALHGQVADEFREVTATDYFWRHLPKNTDRFVVDADKLSAAEGCEWRYVAGSRGLITSGQSWHFVPLSKELPAPNWMWHCEMDSQGFRKRTYPASDKAKRILFLGDSVLFGCGVYGHESLTDKLERFYAAGPYPDAVQCINLGVPGYNTEQEYLALVENYSRIRPAVVVLCCVGNDLEPQSTVPNRPQRLYRHALMGSWFVERAKPLFGLEPSRYAGSPNTDRSWVQDEVKLSAGRSAMSRIVRFCRERNVPLLIVSLPNTSGPNSHARVISRWAGEMGVSFLDLQSAIENREPATIAVSELDTHPNALGHHLFAEALAQPIYQLLSDSKTAPPPATAIPTR